MNRIILFFLATILVWVLFPAREAHAQLAPEGRERIHTVEDTMAMLSHVVFNDTSSARRFAAVRDLIPTLVRALKEDNSFQYPFNRLQHLSIQYPADSSFRVFTWQLYVDKDTYRYYGAIQMNSPELQLYPLVDRSDEVRDVEGAILSPERWYGSVYYHLESFDTGSGKAYLLFGYDGFEFFRKRKVVDVLTFDASGKPVFGAPVFVEQGENGEVRSTRERLLLEYSAEASVRLNFDPALDMIVFDHLIYMDGSHGEGRIGVPDGSYEGYKLEDGRWVYVEKIWNEISEQPPRPFPVLDERSPDLFGRKKNNNNN